MTGLRKPTTNEETTVARTKAIAVEVDDIVGAKEIGERFGVAKNVVGNWSSRYDDYPEPVIVLGMGRAYSWREIVAWYASHWDLPEGVE